MPVEQGYTQGATGGKKTASTEEILALFQKAQQLPDVDDAVFTTPQFKQAVAAVVTPTALPDTRKAAATYVAPQPTYVAPQPAYVAPVTPYVPAKKVSGAEKEEALFQKTVLPAVTAPAPAPTPEAALYTGAQPYVSAAELTPGTWYSQPSITDLTKWATQPPETRGEPQMTPFEVLPGERRAELEFQRPYFEQAVADYYGAPPAGAPILQQAPVTSWSQIPERIAQMIAAAPQGGPGFTFRGPAVPTTTVEEMLQGRSPVEVAANNLYSGWRQTWGSPIRAETVSDILPALQKLGQNLGPSLANIPGAVQRFFKEPTPLEQKLAQTWGTLASGEALSPLGLETPFFSQYGPLGRGTMAGGVLREAELTPFYRVPWTLTRATENIIAGLPEAMQPWATGIFKQALPFVGMTPVEGAKPFTPDLVGQWLREGENMISLLLPQMSMKLSAKPFGQAGPLLSVSELGSLPPSARIMLQVGDKPAWEEFNKDVEAGMDLGTAMKKYYNAIPEIVSGLITSPAPILGKSLTAGIVSTGLLPYNLAVDMARFVGEVAADTPVGKILAKPAASWMIEQRVRPIQDSLVTAFASQPDPPVVTLGRIMLGDQGLYQRLPDETIPVLQQFGARLQDYPKAAAAAEEGATTMERVIDWAVGKYGPPGKLAENLGAEELAEVFVRAEKAMAWRELGLDVQKTGLAGAIQFLGKAWDWSKGARKEMYMSSPSVQIKNFGDNFVKAADAGYTRYVPDLMDAGNKLEQYHLEMVSDYGTAVPRKVAQGFTTAELGGPDINRLAQIPIPLIGTPRGIAKTVWDISSALGHPFSLQKVWQDGFVGPYRTLMNIGPEDMSATPGPAVRAAQAFADNFNFATLMKKLREPGEAIEAVANTGTFVKKFTAELDGNARPVFAQGAFELLRRNGVDENVAAVAAQRIMDPSKVSSVLDVEKVLGELVAPSVKISIMDFIDPEAIASDLYDELRRNLWRLDQDGKLTPEAVNKVVDTYQARLDADYKAAMKQNAAQGTEAGEAVIPRDLQPPRKIGLAEQAVEVAAEKEAFEPLLRGGMGLEYAPRARGQLQVIIEGGESSDAPLIGIKAQEAAGLIELPDSDLLRYLTERYRTQTGAIHEVPVPKTEEPEVVPARAPEAEFPDLAAQIRAAKAAPAVAPEAAPDPLVEYNSKALDMRRASTITGYEYNRFREAINNIQGDKTLTLKQLEAVRTVAKQLGETPEAIAAKLTGGVPPAVTPVEASPVAPPVEAQRIADAMTQTGAPEIVNANVARATSVDAYPVADIGIDPDKFQYKVLKGAAGETGSLRGVEQWDPNLAQGIMLWRDPATRQVWVVNGHNRVALAKSLDVETIPNPYFIPANTAEEARAIGALANIADGKGTAVDAAKFFRSSGLTAAELKTLPITERVVTQGAALANLHDSLFGAVARGEFPIERAVIIGEKIADPMQQLELVKLIDSYVKKGKTVTNATISELADMITEAPVEKYTVQTLFGAEELTKGYTLERAEVLSYIRGELGRDRKVFDAVVRNKARLETIEGNVINKMASEQVSREAAQATEVFDRIKNQAGSPISKLVNDAAKNIGEGANATAVKQQVYQAVRDALSQALDAGEIGGARGGAGLPGILPTEGAGGQQPLLPAYAPEQPYVRGQVGALGPETPAVSRGVEMGAEWPQTAEEAAAFAKGAGGYHEALNDELWSRYNDIGGQIERLRDHIMSYVGSETPAVLQARASSAALQKTIPELVKGWANLSWDTAKKAANETKDTFVDYMVNNRAGEMMSDITPFWKWQVANIPIYLDILERQPQLALAADRYMQWTEQQREDAGLSRRFEGMVLMEADDGSYIALDPLRSILSFVPQVQGLGDEESPEATAGMSPAQKAIHNAVRAWQFFGGSFWPETEALLRAAGTWGDWPARDILPITKIIRLASGIDLEQPLRSVMNKLGGTTDWLLDHWTRVTLDEQVETGEITLDQASQAKLAMSGPLWTRAQEIARDRQDAMGAVAMVVPSRIKYASAAEVEIRQKQEQYFMLTGSEEKKKFLADNPSLTSYWESLYPEDIAGNVRQREYYTQRDALIAEHRTQLEGMEAGKAPERTIRQLEQDFGEKLGDLAEKYKDVLAGWGAPSAISQVADVTGAMRGEELYGEATSFEQVLKPGLAPPGAVRAEKEFEMPGAQIGGVTYDQLLSYRSRNDDPIQAMRRILRDEFYSPAMNIVASKDEAVTSKMKTAAEMSVNQVDRDALIRRVIELHPEWRIDSKAISSMQNWTLPTFDQMSRVNDTPQEALKSEMLAVYFNNSDGSTRSGASQKKLRELWGIASGTTISQFIAALDDKGMKEKLVQVGRLDGLIAEGFPELGQPTGVTAEPTSIAASKAEAYAYAASGAAYELARRKFGDELVDEYSKVGAFWGAGGKGAMPEKLKPLADYLKSVRTQMGITYDETAGAYQTSQVPDWFAEDMTSVDVADKIEGGASTTPAAVVATASSKAATTTKTSTAKTSKTSTAKASTYRATSAKSTGYTSGGTSAGSTTMNWAGLMKEGGIEIAKEVIRSWLGRGDMTPEGKTYLDDVYSKRGTGTMEEWLTGLRSEWAGENPYVLEPKEVETFGKVMAWSELRSRISTLMLVEMEDLFSGKYALSKEGKSFLESLVPNYAGGNTLAQWVGYMGRSWVTSMKTADRAAEIPQEMLDMGNDLKKWEAWAEEMLAQPPGPGLGAGTTSWDAFAQKAGPEATASVVALFEGAGELTDEAYTAVVAAAQEAGAEPAAFLEELYSVWFDRTAATPVV